MSAPSVPPIQVVIPGSKSITIRALVAASLATGRSVLHGPLDSDDTAAAREAMRSIGASIDDHDQSWIVEGVGGHPNASPTPIDVGESGLTARIMVAVAALIEGRTIITGRGRLMERPMGGIVDAARLLGASVTAEGHGLPVEVHGLGHIRGGRIAVDSSVSSQFATASLLVAPFADSTSEIVVEGITGSTGYLNLTIDVIRAFSGRLSETPAAYRVAAHPLHGREFSVEVDASAAVYPMVAAAITGRAVTFKGATAASRQPDWAVGRILEDMGCNIERGEGTSTVQGGQLPLRPVQIDAAGFPDGALALAIAALFASGPSRISGLDSLRHKESDRLAAMSEGLGRVGAKVEIDGDALVITPGPITPALIDAHGDHRVAMSFGVLSLVDEGVVVDSPAVVAKTWPEYWEMIGALRKG